MLSEPQFFWMEIDSFSTDDVVTSITGCNSRRSWYLLSRIEYRSSASSEVNLSRICGCERKILLPLPTILLQTTKLKIDKNL